MPTLDLSSHLALPPVVSLEDTIREHAACAPQNPALVCAGLAPFSFGELDTSIAAFRTEFRDAGLGASARIGTVIPPGPEATFTILVLSAIAVCVPFNPSLSPEEIRSDLERFALDALVVPEWLDLPAYAAPARADYAVFLLSKAAASLSTIRLRRVAPLCARSEHDASPALGRVAALLRTSGTTGEPKLVPVPHRTLFENARKMRRWYDLTSSDRSACIFPVHYSHGFKVTLWAPLLLGGSIALPPLRNPDDLALWIGKLAPTWFSCNPTFVRAVIDRLRARDIERLDSSLRFIACGGFPLPEPVRIECERRLGVPVLEHYGMTEAGLLVSNTVSPDGRKPGTCGRIPKDEVAIRQPDGGLASANETGDVVVRGASVTFAGDDLDSAAIVQAQWRATGDMGTIDEDGFLRIVGRRKEIINRGGEKISPYDVERALLLHPEIKEAAVFAVPHPRLGEAVAAAAVLVPGARVTMSELKEFLSAHLGRFKIPQHLLTLPALPKNSSGKVSRPQLARIFAARMREITPPEDALGYHLLDIWQNLLRRTDIGIDDDFFELGGDSLIATQMLLEVEAITGSTFPQEAISAASTIRGLRSALLSATPSIDKLVTCAKREGSGAPIFFCHGDLHARGFYAFRLAGLMDAPMYLVHPSLLSERKLTVPEMAKHCLDEMLAACPSGPFRIAGFCNGGLLAWELAHQLGRMGRAVETLVLIDVISLNARRSLRLARRAVGAIPLRRIQFETMTAAWRLSGLLLDRDGQLQRLALKMLRSFGNVEENSDWPRIYRFHLDAMAAYVPPPLDLPLVCLLSETGRRQNKFDPRFWRDLVRDLSVQSIPGDHFTSLTKYRRDLANILSRSFPNLSAA